MKFSKLGVMFAAATIAAGAFADAANVLISFSTEGDTYADGTTVLDGEWYALCWSPNAEFGGLDLNCEPVVEGDEVLICAPLAKGGRCPYTIFQVDSADVPKGAGHYFVYMLDTRNAERTAVAGRDSGNELCVPVEVNGAVVSKNFTASATVGSRITSSGATVAGGTWAASGVTGENVTVAKISAIKVENAVVKITVSGMMPGVKYNVEMGPTPTELTSYGLKVPGSGSDGEEATFEVKPGDARFFKVVREPLTK